MFEQYLEQTERFFRPMNEIWALQTQAAETLSKTNSALFSEAWQGGVTLAQSLAAQKSFDDALKLQQQYWQGLTQKVQHAAEENQSVLTNVNQKIADVMQNTSAADMAEDVAAGVAPKSATAAAKAKPAAGASSASAGKSSAAKSTAATKAAEATAAGRSAANPSKPQGVGKAKGAAKSSSKKTEPSKKTSEKPVARAMEAEHKQTPAADPKTDAQPKTAVAADAKSSAAQGKAAASKAANGSSGSAEKSQPEKPKSDKASH